MPASAAPAGKAVRVELRPPDPAIDDGDHAWGPGDGGHGCQQQEAREQEYARAQLAVMQRHAPLIPHTRRAILPRRFGAIGQDEQD